MHKLPRICRITILFLLVLSITRMAAAGSGMVFLGDSITYAGPWAELFPEARVLNEGAPGDTTLDIAARLPRALETIPEKIFLMAGINDLWRGRSPQRAADDYHFLIGKIKEISPESKIYILSVLPVNNQVFPIRIDNQSVRELNERLKKMAGEHKLVYIDLSGRLSGSDGQLELIYTYDGVHLKQEAYLVWKSVIADMVDEP